MDRINNIISGGKSNFEKGGVEEKMNIIESLKEKKKTVKEFVLYGIIGICCATIDSLLFASLSSIHVNMYLANFIGINVGIMCSFLLNTYLNFKKTDQISNRLFKFVGVGYCGLILSMIIMFIGVDVLVQVEMYVKILSVVLVAIFQFVLNKTITYRK